MNGPRTVVTVAHANDNVTMGIEVTSTKVALLTVIVKNNPIQVMSDTYVGHTLDMT